MRYGKPNKPVPISEVIEEKFDPANLDDGGKRGLVKRVYKAKIKKLTGNTAWAKELRYARLLPEEKGPGYGNPTLVIYFQPGSPWINELHHRRYQLQRLINKRLKSKFLNEVKIK